MRDRVGVDKMFLEFRLNRRLNLVNFAHGDLDRGAGGNGTQRDPRPGACRVARTEHMVQRRIRDHPQHHRVFGRDMRPERPGQYDPVDVVDPHFVHQQPGPGVKR